MQHESSIARGVVSLYTANIVTLLAGTAYFIVLTNVLESTEVGVVTALNILVWFLVILCVLGQPLVAQTPIPAPLAVLKFLPELLAKGERSGAIKVLKASLLIPFFLGFAVAGVLFAFPSFFIPILGGNAVTPSLIRLAGVDLVAVSIGQAGLATLIALNETRSAAWHILIWSIVKYGIASILVFPFGAAGVVAGWIIGDSALAYLSLKRCLRGTRVEAGGSFSFFEFARYSAYTLVAALIGFIVTQADRLFTLSAQGLSGLAVYNVAILAASVAGNAPYPIVTVLVPTLAGLYVSKKPEELQVLIRSCTRYISIVVMPFAFGLAALMVVPLRVFGPDYVNGLIPAVIVTLISGLVSLGAAYSSALIAFGKFRWYTAANLLGLAGLFIVTSLTTPILGLNGPALGRASLVLIATIIYAIASFRAHVFGVDLKAYLISIVGSSLMALVLVAVLSLLNTFTSRLFAFPFLVLTGIMIYLVFLRFSRLLSPNDLAFLQNFTPRKLHRLLFLMARLAGVKH